MADWSFTSFAAAAASTLQSAREVADTVTRKIEAELSTEYERTAAAAAGADSTSTNGSQHPPRAPAAAGPTSALDKIASVGAALLNPLDDAVDRVDAPDRVVMLPWEQPGLSEAVRSRMRGLSQERSIFLAPPAGGHSSFVFDLQASLPLIMEALAVDKRLEEQRHLLVPQQVSEEQFFTNYFHALHILATTGACGGGRGGDGRVSPSQPSSSSPVLVSAAASEASEAVDCAETQQQQQQQQQQSHAAPSSHLPHHSRSSSGGGGGGATTNLPPLAELLGAAGGGALATPHRAGATTADAPTEVEQFECVSSHLLESATRRSAAAASSAAAAAGGGAAATPRQTPPARSAASAAHATPRSAQALSLDWEAELQAELS